MLKTVKYITSLREPFYSYVKSREKIWELRLNKGQWSNVYPSDVLLIFRKDGNGEFIIVNVLERREYPSFRKALEEVGIKNSVPDAESIEDALKPYEQFFGPDKEEEKRILAFKIEPIAEYPYELTKEILAKYLPHFKE